MKLLVILLLVSISSYSQSSMIVDTILLTKTGYGLISEKTTHSFDSSVFEIQNEIKNGRYSSYAKEYKTNKIYLENEGFYLNGKRNGLSISYYPSGSIKYIREFREGSLNGYTIDYYENGQVNEMTKMIPWKKFSKFNSWNKKGILTESSYYEDGQLIGLYTNYHDNGNIDSTGYFIPIKGEVINFVEDFETGELIEEVEVLNNIPVQDGLWRYYNIDGDIIYKKYFDKGVLQKVE